MAIQTPKEELLNTWSHGLGILLGCIGFVLMCYTVDSAKPWHLFSTIVYGSSIVVLFFASTVYHAVSKPELKSKYRILDHISIYILIAGTYTPVLLIILPNSLGWTLFYVVWSITLFGVVLKLFFTGKFEIISLLLYLVMGWLIVLDYANLKSLLHPNGINWLFSGGLFYTIGIVFYAVQKIPYNHVIWHFFVLGGAICHFMMIYLYVIQ